MSTAAVTSPKFSMAVPERIVAAAAELITSQGLRGTSVDDIASAAGCGRATVYRYFPGGRAELLEVTMGEGVDRIFALCAQVTDNAASLAEAVAGTINIAVLELSNDAVVQQLLVDEPDTIATLISPMRIEPLFERASEWGAEHFSRFLEPAIAAHVGEWCVRVVTDHLRSPAPIIDITDLSLARTLVDTFLIPTLIPGILADQTTMTRNY
ncbi:MAG: TetR/AcrR family transcriptional regulator [Actinobacteria bacterium]|nr:TetR/AcrR family transcriptional regulator [Actinomycetota bacterium]